MITSLALVETGHSFCIIPRHRHQKSHVTLLLHQSGMLRMDIRSGFRTDGVRRFVYHLSFLRSDTDSTYRLTQCSRRIVMAKKRVSRGTKKKTPRRSGAAEGGRTRQRAPRMRRLSTSGRKDASNTVVVPLYPRHRPPTRGEALKENGDLALFGGKAMGEQTRMAYWADILHDPQQSLAQSMRARRGSALSNDDPIGSHPPQRRY